MMTEEQIKKKKQKEGESTNDSVFEQATGENEGGYFEDNYLPMQDPLIVEMTN